MPTINRENIGVLNDRITITVNEEDYNPGFEESLKNYSKNANLPGFRKGKVPRSLVKKMYGQELFPQEILKSVEEGLNSYIKKENLDLFGQPILKENEQMPKVDMNDPKDYSFEFEIGLRPKVDVQEVKEKLKFEQYKVTPKKKEIDEEIADMQKRAATFEETEAIENDDDMISVVFQPADKDGKVAEDAPRKEEKFRFNYFAPEFGKKLKDKKKGDALVSTLKEVFEEKELDWVKKDWKLTGEKPEDETYQVSIDKIEKAVPHKMDKDFYEMVFPNSGITKKEDFVKRLTEDYQAQWNHQAKHLLEHEIFEKLVKEVKIDLPVDFLKEQLKREDRKPKTDEEVEKAYPEFEEQTRWGVITSSIISAENLDASPEEIRDMLRQQVLGYFQMPNVTEESKQMVDDLTNRLLQQEGQVDQAYRTIITNKMFDWLISNAEITEKEIGTEDFKKLMEEHNHQHHEHE